MRAKLKCSFILGHRYNILSAIPLALHPLSRKFFALSSFCSTLHLNQFITTRAHVNMHRRQHEAEQNYRCNESRSRLMTQMSSVRRMPYACPTCLSLDLFAFSKKSHVKVRVYCSRREGESWVVVVFYISRWKLERGVVLLYLGQEKKLGWWR